MTSATAAAEKPATEIQQPPANYLPAAGQTPRPALATGSKIAALVPTDLEQAFRLARAIATAGFAPKGYLVDPKDDKKGFDENKIMVGILHGMEVGFTPMAALQSIAVINGMPSIWGDGALALVRASGLLEDIQERLEGEGKDQVAICTVIRRGQPAPVVRTFSIPNAAKAGLLSKTGPWQQYPHRMLQMRARSWALRDAFADVLRGLSIAEEVRDMGDLQESPDGVYRSAADVPPPPTRAAIADQVRAERVIENDLNRGSDRMPDTPEERGDEPEADPETGEIREPTQIPVPVGADNKPDWTAWRDLAVAAIEAAPDLDWLRAWNVMHGGALNNLKKAAAQLHGDVTEAIERRRVALSA